MICKHCQLPVNFIPDSLITSDLVSHPELAHFTCFDVKSAEQKVIDT